MARASVFSYIITEDSLDFLSGYITGYVSIFKMIQHTSDKLYLLEPDTLITLRKIIDVRKDNGPYST
jgi:hypothetical protein